MDTWEARFRYHKALFPCVDCFALLTCVHLGKSVLSSQIIYYLRNFPRHVCFFFCDYHTPSSTASACIWGSFCAQLVRISPTLVPYLYDEYVAKGKRPSVNTLKEILPIFLQHLNNVCLVVDMIDEIPSEHQRLIKDLIQLTKGQASTCKALIVSQDIPSIGAQLSDSKRLPMGEEMGYVRRDLAMIIERGLLEINDLYNGALKPATIQSLQNEILDKAEGKLQLTDEEDRH